MRALVPNPARPVRHHFLIWYRARYGEVSIYAGNDSGKVGELSKLTAVFPPVDKFLTVRKRKKQQKKVSIQHIVDD